MKTITKIIFLFLFSVAFAGCTIVMPTPETAKTKEPSYTRPTPTTTVTDSPSSTRPRPVREEPIPAYTRPTPTTTAGASNPNYTRPKPTSTVKKVGSDGRIDAPKGKHAEHEAVSDTIKQARSRVRR